MKFPVRLLAFQITSRNACKKSYPRLDIKAGALIKKQNRPALRVKCWAVFEKLTAALGSFLLLSRFLSLHCSLFFLHFEIVRWAWRITDVTPTKY